ncbi:UNKNOWN [Stylonychia lemnae]|uniref:Transmembrane protein n=1 Tax=Stylonychia lemnae TaxID=5949 RepID=A0A078A289_STYLE|nr:UNKNOWN [Stylonychia lemnae]|eukprot:CDW76255.1 UNKNOWN [Stylonychia lemnae]
MKDYMSVRLYVWTLVFRAIWSSILASVAIAGMGVSATNNLQNNYLDFFFFMIIFLLEIIGIFYYLCLFKKQRHQQNLDRINKFDCVYTCLMTFFRLGWHIALGLFIIVHILQLNLAKKNIQWTSIKNLCIVILVFSIMGIIGFVIGIVYQPQEYEKEIEFNNILDEVKDDSERYIQEDIDDQMSQRQEFKKESNNHNVQQYQHQSKQSKNDQVKRSLEVIQEQNDEGISNYNNTHKQI